MPLFDRIQRAWDALTGENRAGVVNSTGANFDLAFTALDDYIATGRPSVAQTAAVEIAVGTTARAFMGAQVEGATISPVMLEMIARQVSTFGNFVARIELDGINPILIPAYEYKITGDVLSSTWRYQMSFARPSDPNNERPERRNLPYEGVVHVRYGVSPADLSKGTPALARGPITAEQLAYIDDRLRAYSKMPAGGLIAAPDGASQTSVDSAENAVRTAQGSLTIVESMSGGWGGGQASAPRNDWQQVLFGPNPPSSAQALRDSNVRLLMQQMGVPAGLLDGQGAALRESNRHFMTATLEPIAAVIEAELSEKFNRPVTISFPEIVLGDIAARARALPNLIAAGVPAIDALNILRIPTAGITLTDEFDDAG